MITAADVRDEGRVSEKMQAVIHEAERLRAALKRYGKHDSSCAVYRMKFRARFRNAEPTCLCGFSAALAEPHEDS